MVHPQRGNILFLILLAVVLFAALTYAVTSSMNGGGKNASAETERTGAASIAGFIGAVQNTVQRLTTTGGYRLDQISFGYDSTNYGGTVTANMYQNTNCTVDACKVFKQVAPITFEKYAFTDPPGWVTTYPKPGFYDMLMMQWPGAGTDANDIVLRVMALQLGVCNAFKESLGLQGTLVTGGTGLGVGDPTYWNNPGYTISPAQYTYGQSVGVVVTSQYCFIFAVVGAR